MATLRRLSDGAGDSGAMSMLIKCEKNENGVWRLVVDENGDPVVEYGKPKVGYAVRVGSSIARSYSQYDYWTTTPVTKILEETESMVKFKTTNSEYVWTA